MEDASVDVVDEKPPAEVREYPAVEPIAFRDFAAGQIRDVPRARAERIRRRVGIRVEGRVVAAQLDAVRGGVGEELRLAHLAGEADAPAPTGIALAPEVLRASRDVFLHEPAGASGRGDVEDLRGAVERIARRADDEATANPLPKLYHDRRDDGERPRRFPREPKDMTPELTDNAEV